MEEKIASDRAAMQQHVQRLQIQEQQAESAIALERTQRQQIGSEASAQSLTLQSEALQFEQNTRAQLQRQAHEE
eukprot:654219-Prorocentrum_lima.AAC.1